MPELANAHTVDTLAEWQITINARSSIIKLEWAEGYNRTSDGAFVRIRRNGLQLRDGQRDGEPVSEYTAFMDAVTQDNETLGDALRRIGAAALQQKGIL